MMIHPPISPACSDVDFVAVSVRPGAVIKKAASAAFPEGFSSRDSVGHKRGPTTKNYRKNNEHAFKRANAQSYLNSVISGKLLAKRGSVAYKMFGATREELISHIENQFEDGWNWENRGDVWEIDHIRPYSSFDLTDDKQYRECCNYKNIRPLSVKENRGRTPRVKRTKKL